MTSSRRVTRRYEAGRRNGHFTSTPTAKASDSDTTATERALSHVKRKLSFGRKPPQRRQAEASTSKEKSAGRKKSKTGSKSCVRKSKTTITREIRDILNAAKDVILPVRLRSAMHDLVRKGKKKSGYRLKPSPEGTDIHQSRSKRETTAKWKSTPRKLML